MPDPLITSLITGASIIGAGAAGSYFGFKPLFKCFNRDLKMSFLSDTLDFDTVHKDAKTLVGREGGLTRVFALKGKDYGICNLETIRSLHARRVQFFDELVAKDNLQITIFTDRFKESSIESYEFDNINLQAINDLWQKQFTDTYQSRYYIVMTQNPTRLKKIPEKGVFDDLCDRLKEFLDEYQITDVRYDTGDLSDLLSFWGRKINGDFTFKLRPFSNHLAERMVGKSIEFDLKQGLISFDDERYAGIISVNEWGQESDSGLTKELSNLPLDLSFIQHITGISKLKSQIYLNQKKSSAGSIFNGLTFKKDEEFQVASDIIENDDGTLQKLQFSVLVYGKTPEDVKDNISTINKLFQSYGVNCVREKLAIEAVWRSQFPGYSSYIRQSTLLSQNVSDLVAFSKEAEGVKNSDWGPGPLRQFKTISGGSYPLNLHVSDRSEATGHNLVIASTETGKTTLIQHIIAGALRHKDLRVFMLDRLNGTQVFTESCGGDYIDIENQQTVSLNPFKVLESTSDKSRLRRLLKLMSGLPEDQIPKAELNAIVDLLEGLPPELRVLSNIHDTLFEHQTPLSESLRDWAIGANAHWFNGERFNAQGHKEAYDSLDLDAKRLVGIEMTNILDEQRQDPATGPVVYYLMERMLSVIRSSPNPSWIFIDETNPMLKVPFFKSYVEVLLKEIRKLRGCVTLCFQSAKDIRESGMQDVIFGQCKTKFLFPNPDANYEDYEALNLTESEWDYVRGENKVAKKLKHTVLVKKPHESVILDIDLSCLGKHLTLYKSGKDAVQKAKSLQQTRGDQWVESYLA